MILKVLNETLGKIVFNPLTLLPFTALTIFGILFSEIIFSLNDKLITDFILNYEMLEGSNILFIVLTQYPIELFLTIIITLMSFVILIITILSITRIAKKENIIDAIDNSIRDWKKATFLAFYSALVFFLYLIILIIIGFIFQLVEGLLPLLQNSLTLILFPIIMVGGMILILTKTIFVIPAIIEMNLKRAIQESWSFTNDKFWSVFILIIILMIISAIIGFMSVILVQILGSNFELIINYAADIIASTFFILAIAYYYYSY